MSQLQSRQAASTLSEGSDQALISGLRAGSEAAFNQLYERFFQRIYNFAQTRLRNHADAEEVAQETFTAVFRSIGAFRGRSSLSSWIYGIAKNNVNNHLRRAKAQVARIEKADGDVLRPSQSLEACRPDDHLSLTRYMEAVRERLDAVAPWQVEVFELRHMDNLAIKEIADRTSRSSDAIRSSLYRIKRLLVEESSAWEPVDEVRQGAGSQA